MTDQPTPQPIPQQDTSPQPYPVTTPPAPQPPQKQKKPIFKKWWFWAIIVVVLLTIIGAASGNEQGESSKSASSTASSAPAKSAEPAEPAQPLTAMTASYTGKTEAGTVIKNGTLGLSVIGTYADGSQKALTDYTVDPPVTLVAGETSAVNIFSKDLSCAIEVTCTTQTPEQYRAGCQPVDYQTLARDPDAWKGANVTVTGKIIQVMENAGQNTYRISITKGSYGIWTDTILVKYKPADSGTRLLEDDIVVVYGQSTGLYTYTTVLGASQTVPSIDAKYIDLA